MKKIIFLDIDGVLIPSAVKFQYRKNHKKGISNNTDEFGHLFHQPCVDALNYIIEKTGAEIIMSSHWRYNFYDVLNVNISKLNKLAEIRGIKGTFIGITPLFDNIREELINMSVNDTISLIRSMITYCVLDDECKDFTLHLENKVDIDHKVGLTMENAEQAIRILNKKYDRN